MKPRHACLNGPTVLWIALSATVVVVGCKQRLQQTTTGSEVSSSGEISTAPAPPAVRVDPCSLVLVPHTGEGRIDREIARLQEEVRQSDRPAVALERLGWLFVAKARESFDPGYYKLAEQCALCLDSKQSGSAEALLLRGHVLHNLHRFQEAETLARQLVAQRGLAFDYGLLGDVWMEQGRLDEAIGAYQKMLDLKPDPQAYARVAHVRWLKGDLAGAVEAAQWAADSSSPAAPEASAWFHTRLAFYKFQSGATIEADHACAEALTYQRDFPPALLLRGRMLLSQGEAAEALPPLRRAVELNPLPEYQWLLAEALRAAGRGAEAEAVETDLARRAAATDPRTYALYLATRGESPELALRLAERELVGRGDVFTQDALAWALAGAGRLDEARRHLERALAEGTQDARLYFHAAVIAAKSGQKSEAQRWFDRASGGLHLLMPSEQAQLISALSHDDAPDVTRSTDQDLTPAGH
jgi:tetratricopeptide (TPR) repeat protein